MKRKTITVGERVVWEWRKRNENTHKTADLSEREVKRKKHWENLPFTRWIQANSDMNVSDGSRLYTIWFLIKQNFS